MNRLFALSLVALISFGSGPVSADVSTIEHRRKQCVAWMMSDYPSGIQEASCVSEFSLPSAFMFKCAWAERNGYRNELQRKACVFFFAKASNNAENGFVRN